MTRKRARSLFGQLEVVRICLGPRAAESAPPDGLWDALRAASDQPRDAAAVARSRAAVADWNTAWVAAAALGGFLCFGYGPEHEAHVAEDAANGFFR